MEEIPFWIQQAAAMPVAFAQVREDALLDQWVVQQLPPPVDVLLVASGGCTASLLAADPRIRRLHLVDANPAQLALTKLKLWLLQHTDRAERLAVLGHSNLQSGERGVRVERILDELNLPADILGPMAMIDEIGPDFCGRYERLFGTLQAELGDCRDELLATLELTDVEEQRQRTDWPTHLGRRLQEALDKVMSLPNLVRLFGSEATNNPAQPFPRHFLARIKHTLRTLPARTNPYVWQMLLGTYLDGHVAPWFESARIERVPDVSWTNGCMDYALESRELDFDFIQLSNILDWLTPQDAQRTLKFAWQALRPGGRVLVRQLNSSLDIPALGPQFQWLASDAATLHQRDRSFFYRQIHLGAKH